MRKELLDAIIGSGKQVARVEMQEVTMAPGIKAPLHLHPCPAIGVITEGCITFQIEGQAEQHLKAGDAFYEPENARIAKFNNESDLPAKSVVLYLLGKDQKETVEILDS